MLLHIFVLDQLVNNIDHSFISKSKKVQRRRYCDVGYFSRCPSR